MKKLMLCSILSILFFNVFSQDTTCTYFKGKRVIEFDYQTSEIIYEVKQYTRFFDITVEYGDVLCLDLSDEKNRTRKVITTFFDGSTREDTLDSKNSVYFSPQGATKVSVGRPKIFKI
jgi:hypothetical protein